MKPRGGFAVPAISKLNAPIKVDAVPTSLQQNEEQEGMTTTTADSTFTMTKGATLTKPCHQVKSKEEKRKKGKNGKVPNVVRMEKEDNHPMTFKEMAEDAIGHPYHDVLFMTRKEIRDEGDLLVHNAYMKMRTKILGPGSTNYVPRKRKIVKTASKWKAQTRPPTDEEEISTRKHNWETQGIQILRESTAKPKIWEETKRGISICIWRNRGETDSGENETISLEPQD